MKEVSSRIRELRIEKKFTLKDLSEKTGLSVSFLSQVERASSSLAITSLKKIADALEVPITRFFEDFSNDTFHVKKEEQKPFKLEGSSVTYTRLGGEFSGRSIEPLLVTYPPGSTPEKNFSHPGEEFYYILEGELIFEVDGKEFILKPGDSIHFPSTLSHAVRNPLQVDAKVLSIVTPVIF